MSLQVASNEKTRIDWVSKQLNLIPEGASILDAGAGEQQYRKFCSHLVYTSQDFAQYNPMNVDSGLHVSKWEYGKLDIISDITAIPREDKSFDAILCTEVLEHLPDPLAALREFSRLLKPGGVLILTAPFTSMTHFAPYHFVTGFSTHFYLHHLPLLGFSITEMTPNGNYFSSLYQEVERFPYIAQSYGLIQPGKLKRIAINIVLKILGGYSMIDSGSSELMCFGWHVVANKN